MRAFVLICLMLLIGAAWAASEKDSNKPNPNLGIETVWGPDAFGYIAKDSNEPDGPPVDWIDISAIGTVVSGLGDDNIVGPFNTGLNFRYYWYDVTSFYVGSNGYIRFSGGGQLSDPFSTIPNPAAPNDIICPYTADFDPGSAGTVYYWSNNIDTLIVSWDHIPAWLPGGSSGDHNFQIVLSMVDTSITFNIGPQSGTFSNANGMVGIEDLAGNIGIYNYSTNVIPANYSIKFYYPPVILIDIHDMAVTRVQNDNSGGFFVQTGGTLQANATIRNTGNQNESNFYAIAEVRQYPSNILMEQDSFHVAALNAGETLDITFSETWTLPNTGNYYLRVRTNLAGDMVASNNQIDVEMHVVDLPGELSFDDGIAEQTWSWNGGFGGMAVYYVPPVYPAKITQISGYLGAGTTSTFLEIYDDDGPNGQPGSVIANFSVTATTAGFFTIDLSDSNFVIEDGGVYPAWRMNGTTSSGIGLDQNTIASRQTWEYTGVWAVFRNFGTDDAMLRISVEEPQGPLNPPTNLSAQGGNGVVNLMWNPPIVVVPGTELFYDDGTGEGNLSIGSTAEGDLAVRFTPNVYPSTLMAIKVFFAAAATGMTSADWTVYDGTTSGPGTSLGTGNQVINRGAFDVVDISSAGIQITANDFFISYHEPNGQTLNLAWDTNQPSANRSWVNAPTIGFPWQTLAATGIAGFDNNLMIRAIVQEGTGPNARLVELSPNGERKVLSAAEEKRLAAQNNTLGKNAFTGAVCLDGTQLPQTGGQASNHGGTPSLIEDLNGYNVYRSENGASFNFLANVDATTLEYSDSSVTNGTDYWYYVTAVYPEGESEPSDTVMATPTAPTEFFDDFDAYTAGVQLVVQNSTDWTTWSNLPGSGEDPFVSDAHAYSGANAVVLAQNNDLVKVFAPAPITSGIWEMSWQMYIPSGGAGYFNTLADFAGANSIWAMQVFFDAGGTGRLDAGGASAATFTYPYDTWMPVVVIVDLNTDAAEFWLNGSMIYSWQYTLGTFGTPIPLQLDANNFYGATAVDQMYVDDYTVEPYIVGIDDEISALPTEFTLEQNFPNPFNPTTTIKYALKENADVTLKIYNVLGQVVKTLVNARQDAGFKTVNWDGTNELGAKVSSGIYIYRIEANDFVQSKKLILMK